MKNADREYACLHFTKNWWHKQPLSITYENQLRTSDAIKEGTEGLPLFFM